MRKLIHFVFTKYKIEIDSIILNRSNFYLIKGEGLSKKEDYEIFLKNKKICLFYKLDVLIEETNSKFSKHDYEKILFRTFYSEIKKFRIQSIHNYIIRNNFIINFDLIRDNHNKEKIKFNRGYCFHLYKLLILCKDYYCQVDKDYAKHFNSVKFQKFTDIMIDIVFEEYGKSMKYYSDIVYKIMQDNYFRKFIKNFENLIIVR